jgi:inner membrane protein
MPSAITHAAVGAAAAWAFAPSGAPKYLGVLAVVCSVFPDIDVIAFFYRLPYPHFFFHRGFFHSLFFSLILSFAILTIFFHDPKQFSRRSFSFFVFFFLLTASHGLLDALNSGGYGVALFLPFDDSRYSFPWTPLPISSIGIRSFFSPWGWTVVKSELLWIWLPSLFLVLISRSVRSAFAGHEKKRVGL